MHSQVAQLWAFGDVDAAAGGDRAVRADEHADVVGGARDGAGGDELVEDGAATAVEVAGALILQGSDSGGIGADADLGMVAGG